MKFNLALAPEFLWGEKAKLRYLLLASVILLFTFLGAREVWTQEHRWADIVLGMFYRRDFFHPYLGEVYYYDKPLLSYWLMALFAKLLGTLNTWALRLPSALAGVLAIWSIYRLGVQLKDKRLGLLSGWLLLTTFYFVFWARTSSTDMLNLAGTLFAIAWYMEKENEVNFFNYSIFFLIVAITSLCKGLLGAIVPGLAILTHLCLQKSWRKHFNFSLLLSLIPALILYLAPFFASSFFAGQANGQNELYTVYRENFLRYFEPFDHQGPIYLYFIFLPIYLLPSAIFFFPALFKQPTNWRTMSLQSKWIVLIFFVLFLFFTFSGSRRNYYVLPIVPFAILLTADWMLTRPIAFTKLRASLASLILVSFILLFIAVDLFPAWYYNEHGISRFANKLQLETNKIKPWNTWNVISLDGESKLNFYLKLQLNSKRYHMRGIREQQTKESIAKMWPILLNPPPNTIFVTRILYKPILAEYLKNYRIVEMPPEKNVPFLKKGKVNIPIAYIPNN